MIYSKPNHDKVREPKLGRKWCKACDRCEIRDGQKCPICSNRDLSKRRKRICKAFIISLIHLRWAYFHVHPSYIKFSVKEGVDKPTEYYFFNTRENSIHYNLEWVD